jgi:putative ABC transport system substrate-binding protein
MLRVQNRHGPGDRRILPLGAVAIRRLLVALLPSILFVVPLVAASQPAGRPARVGVLTIGAPNLTATNPGASRLWPPFLQELRDRGYVEGANLAVEWRFADWRPDRLPTLAAELARASVDVIVVGGPHGVEAARNTTASIPIVMVASTDDPVAAGWVASLARPGGNVTGLSFAVSPEIVGKQLEIFAELVPGLRRVGILKDAETPGLRRTWREFTEAARRLGLPEPDVIEVRELPQLAPAFSEAARTRAQGLLVTMAGITFAQRSRVAQLGLDGRLPVFAYFRELPEAGGLMSYGPDLRDIYRRAAGYVDRILRGARPAEMPVEQPTKFELVVNLRTARALGIRMPPSVLARSDEIIE